MNRFVVMVDAGYLLRQSIELVSKRSSHQRADLQITDPAGLIAVIVSKAKSLLALDDKELLRVYWYDGVMANGLTAQQKAIVDVDDVQFRAGTINSAMQQKGVDSLIVTDLIELTTHHAICDAILVTGDSDLAVGIELAQKRGVRIAVLGVEDLAAGVAHHQSWEITSRADRVGRLGSADISNVVKYTPKAAAGAGAAKQGAPAAPGQALKAAAQPVQASSPPPVQSAPRQLTQTDQAEITDAVQEFIKGQAAPEVAVDPATNRIDSAMDRSLIHYVFGKLSRGQLTNQEKIFARSAFRAQLSATKKPGV